MKCPIPHRLAQARQANGISQRQLGIKIGIDPFAASPRINQYERGKHTPDYSTLARIAKVLDVPVPYLYTSDDPLAEIILRYSQLSHAGRIKLIKFLKTL